ncbi:GH25 family lysozyme [Camelliibacillus cellulosilyticus]|uniref:Lysozyme n=1 Tax=Camelliibacillus cellulosilyticus TaxID=2174486 RepID=A0ABV9GJU7_9BACL
MQKRKKDNWQGVDVSHWQGDIDWARVRASGMLFAYIKATEGETFVDPKLKKNAKAAKQAGLTIGFYHFGRFSSEQAAEHEAAHFLKTVKNIKADLPLVLDLETDNGLTKDALSKAAQLFLETVKKESGQDVMLYTYTNFAKTRLTRLLRPFPLWIAHYGRETPGKNGIWDNWRAFQYTNKGRVAGISGDVDLDEMVPFEKVVDKTAPQEPAFYIIREGDTFWDLENRFDLAHGTLQKANPDLVPTKLKIGTRIKLPFGNPSRVHTIKKGETFWGLEQSNGWPQGILTKLNPHLDPKKLSIGQRIRTP